MIETLIGGFIAITSGIVIGILTPSINSRIKKRNLLMQEMLKLISTLYLLKNNLVNYLNQDIYIDILGEFEAGKKEIDKLKNIDNHITNNIESLYLIQQEIILNFKNEPSSISLIYGKIDELEHLIWQQKRTFNIQKDIIDQESSDDYSKQLDKMIIEKLVPIIESIIELNKRTLKIKLKSTKR